MTWRSCAHLLYSNWLNYFVYQTSPYNIRDIERGIRHDDSSPPPFRPLLRPERFSLIATLKKFS